MEVKGLIVVTGVPDVTLAAPYTTLFKTSFPPHLTSTAVPGVGNGLGETGGVTTKLATSNRAGANPSSLHEIKKTDAQGISKSSFISFLI